MRAIQRLKFTLCFVIILGLFGFSSEGIFYSFVQVKSNAMILRQGSRGDDVTRLQSELKKLGYFDLSPTGYFGDITRRAVVSFQRDNDLVEDGIVGENTFARLHKMNSGSFETLRVGSESRKVENLQSKLKELGYFNFRVTGFYGSITADAVRAFQRDNSLMVDGIAGSRTKQALYLGQQSSRGGILKGELIGWFSGGSDIFYLDADVIVTDIKTGLSFNARRTGGYNHADCETLTKEDTQILRRIYGGNWSWDRRAVVVEVNGRRIAGSMTGMPHAGRDDMPARVMVDNRSGGFGTGINYNSIHGNGMDGHFDIHLLNSRTHGTDRVDERHSQMVLRAAGR